MDTPATTIVWPPKHDVFGVQVSATRYDEVVEKVIAAARGRQSALVDFMPVHGLIPAVQDPKHLARLNQFQIVAPDGQPVRWALNYFYKTGLTDRVYGPELTWRLCRAAAEAKVGIYLFGSTPDVLEKLQAKLLGAFPDLYIAGAESPPFRPLTPEEDRAAVGRINASGAGLLFLGTGSPRQEVFAFEHRDSIHAVQLCVGAAFDFHAGTKKIAPAWMQKRGLEWLFRLTQEPGRLWKRYLVMNSTYVMLFIREALRPGRRRTAVAEQR
jgi:N-acetylglucosaminyldiphosphoundecaprenol N-acetyl-beta-D-mannosaminyltransferase